MGHVKSLVAISLTALVTIFPNSSVANEISEQIAALLGAKLDVSSTLPDNKSLEVSLPI